MVPARLPRNTFCQALVGQSAPGGYSVSHSAYVYLLDQRGAVRALFGDGTKPAEIADGVRQLLADSTSR